MVQMENDVYTQIGLVMLIAWAPRIPSLSSRSPKRTTTRYVSRRCSTFGGEASVPAADDDSARLYCRVRAAMDSVRRRLSRATDYRTTVIGGMLAETFIGRFFVPAIFYVVEKFSGAEKRKALPLTPAEAPSLGD